MFIYYQPPPRTPVEVVFEQSVTDVCSGTCSKEIFNIYGIASNYEVLVDPQEMQAIQVQVTDDAATAVPLHVHRLAQTELMDLPTVEFRSNRSKGQPRGKMIVMRKRA